MDQWEQLTLRAARDLDRAGFSRLCVQDDALDDSEIENLRTVIDSATTEAPIQKYLTEQPHQIRGGFDGHCRWLKAHPELGRYVPDFLVGRVDTSGMRWSLIELESPQPGRLFTKSGRKSEQLDKGIDQIREWRKWLEVNGGMARRSIKDDGLGLTDLSHRASALILIGRRRDWSEEDVSRIHDLGYEQRIEIHSYDFLKHPAIHQQNTRSKGIGEGLWTVERQRRGGFYCNDCDPIREVAQPRARSFTLARFERIMETGSVVS